MKTILSNQTVDIPDNGMSNVMLWECISGLLRRMYDLKVLMDF